MRGLGVILVGFLGASIGGTEGLAFRKGRGSPDSKHGLAGVGSGEDGRSGPATGRRVALASAASD